MNKGNYDYQYINILRMVIKIHCVCSEKDVSSSDDDSDDEDGAGQYDDLLEAAEAFAHEAQPEDGLGAEMPEIFRRSLPGNWRSASAAFKMIT